MGKYFGRQPRYSQEEAEAQAKQAIDAAVSRGRPPAEEWTALQGRMGEINRELATRPPVDLPPPPPRRATPERRPVNQILRPQPAPEPEPEPEPLPQRPPAAAKKPVAKKAVVKKAVVKKAVVKPAPPPAKAKAPAAKRPPAKKRTT